MDTEAQPEQLSQEGFAARQAFLDMIGSVEYLAIGNLRTEALAKSELHPMDQGQLA